MACLGVDVLFICSHTQFDIKKRDADGGKERASGVQCNSEKAHLIAFPGRAIHLGAVIVTTGHNGPSKGKQEAAKAVFNSFPEDIQRTLCSFDLLFYP